MRFPGSPDEPEGTAKEDQQEYDGCGYRWEVVPKVVVAFVRLKDGHSR